MPRPLPPDVITQLVAAFEQTGNVSEAARIVGVPRSTAADSLRRAALVNRRQIHARACEEGLRAGRRAVRAELTRIDKYIETAVGDGTSPSCEPRDYSALVRAKTDVVRTIIACDERVGARRIEHLQRETMRAKLEAMRSIGSDLAGATDEELATVRAILERARTRGPTASDQGGASEPEPHEPADG